MSHSKTIVRHPAPRSEGGVGGYDCQFIEPLHDQLQVKCPVCLCVLRSPHMVGCCGYSFCKECIATIKANKKTCPLCNEDFVNVLPDKRLNRVLNMLRVSCVHEKLGCEWQDELGKMEEHLNSSPSPEQKLFGCVYTKVKCDDCDTWIERRKVMDHLYECGMQPYSCDYCHQYQSSREDVTVNHWMVCPCRPISCPNECGVYPERQHMKTHLSNQCEEAVMACEFSSVGCVTDIRRKDMQEHLTKDVVHHLTLQMCYYRDGFARLENQLQECVTRMDHLEKENARLKSTLTLREEDANMVFNKVNASSVNSTALNVAQIMTKRRHSNTGVEDKKQWMDEIEAIKSLVCVAPIHFTIHSVSSLQRHQGKWVSAPFYTHAQGYRMCLKVYPNGYATSEGSEVTLYVCIMKGKYDKLLKWPFKGLVVLQLLDQKSGTDHLVRTVDFHEGLNEKFSGRVQDSDMTGGWGILKFASIAELVPKYLRNDCLQIRVDRVQIR